MSTVRLQHGKVGLALHELCPGDGPCLLLLHGLGTRTPETIPVEVEGWPGAVHGLDFTGHGASDLAPGGGYTAEVLLADADVALAHLGPATVLGHGLGAWVALLVAGARADLVRGAVLADGPGLSGGGVAPGTAHIPRPAAAGPDRPDRFALAELSHDLRPADYATFFAHLASIDAAPDRPGLIVAARQRPPWVEAVVATPGVQQAPVTEALARYAG